MQIIVVVVITTPSVIGNEKWTTSKWSEYRTPNCTHKNIIHRPNERTNSEQKWMSKCVNKRAIWFSNCDTETDEGKTQKRKFILKIFVRCPISSELWVLCTPAQVRALVCRRVLVCLFVRADFGVFVIVFLLRSFIWSYLSGIIINYCRDCFWIEIDQRNKSHGLTPCFASVGKVHIQTQSAIISIRWMWINTLEKHIESVITELAKVTKDSQSWLSQHHERHRGWRRLFTIQCASNEKNRNRK